MKHQIKFGLEYSNSEGENTTEKKKQVKESALEKKATKIFRSFIVLIIALAVLAFAVSCLLNELAPFLKSLTNELTTGFNSDLFVK